MIEQNRPTRITMLGTTSTGKTCFMLGMYSVMREGVEGFTFAAVNPETGKIDFDKDIKLSDRYSNMVYTKGTERWPDGTSVPEIYHFSFNYALEPIHYFEWIDYRGGALRDSSEQEDVQELIKFLQTSSCVFLCISAEYWIADDVTNASADIPKIKRDLREGMRNMQNRLTDLVDQTGKKPPIVIVITKSDLILNTSMTLEQRESIKQNVIDELREKRFKSLFVPDGGWLVGVCFVSLGDELSSNSDSGEINPIQIHAPVSFAMYTSFKDLAREERSKIQQRQADERRQRDQAHSRAEALKGGFLGIGGWFKKDEIQRLIDFGKSPIAISSHKIDAIEKNINRLVETMLEYSNVFFEGEEMEL